MINILWYRAHHLPALFWLLTFGQWPLTLQGHVMTLKVTLMLPKTVKVKSLTSRKVQLDSSSRPSSRKVFSWIWGRHRQIFFSVGFQLGLPGVSIVVWFEIQAAHIIIHQFISTRKQGRKSLTHEGHNDTLLSLRFSSIMEGCSLVF